MKLSKSKEIQIYCKADLRKTKKVRIISKWVNAHQKKASKKRQKQDFFQTKKMQNIVKNILQNKIEQIKKNTNVLQNILAQVKKKKEII